jgi:hypothetical protein
VCRSKRKEKQGARRVRSNKDKEGASRMSKVARSKRRARIFPMIGNYNQWRNYGGTYCPKTPPN